MPATERCLTLPEMVDKIISFLDKNNQLNCLRINSIWHNSAHPRVAKSVLSYDLDSELYRRRVADLLAQPLAQKALVRNAGRLRNLHIGIPGILPVLITAPHCTKLDIILCSLAASSSRQRLTCWCP